MDYMSLGIIYKKGMSVVSSRKVAEVFHKSHFHVLRDIEGLDCSRKFCKTNFGLSSAAQKMPRGGVKKVPEYWITKDGFMFLVMGYTGERAAKFKEAYIAAFNKMELILREYHAVRNKSRIGRNEFAMDAMSSEELRLITASELIAVAKIEKTNALGYEECNPECLISSIAVSIAVGGKQVWD